jgi:hypothetical protein
MYAALRKKNKDEYGRVSLKHAYISHKHLFSLIRVIAKLPNSEQTYKGKVKTHNYINDLLVLAEMAKNKANNTCGYVSHL